MNTKNWTRHLAWGVLGLVCQQAFSQASQADNNGGFSSFLGWNALANQVLEVRNDANQPIDWYTNAIRRMRLTPNVTTDMGPGNPFPNVNHDGFFLLSGQPDAFTNAGSRAPFTRLHLIDQVGSVAPVVYAQEHGFRPWQRNGITFTGNADHGYVGQKAQDLDYTDMIIHWSDKQRLKRPRPNAPC